MNVSLKGMLNNAAYDSKSEVTAFTLQELYNNLLEVHKGWLEGRSEEILDEFFALYIVDAQKRKEVQP